MSKAEQPSHGKSGFSRRAFLKGSGAAAAASAIAGAPALAAEEQGPGVVAGMTTIVLNVNGQLQKVQVEPRTTLLEALRYGLNLTGAKPISVDGSSGGSTVLVDGKPISANSMLALQCVGVPILTAESMGGPKVDPVSAAFAHHDASQCGFCTPGFVVAVKAFLAKNPKATDAEIRAGLNGNLCRCGTYANIIPAVLDVVKGARNG
jgi:aerobic-type carbon monoxide dehydrogenase small subunit (CoxS/CutS family)